MNQKRAAYHLPPLRPSGMLGRVATKYAKHMVSSDDFSHVDSAGHNVLYRVTHGNRALARRWRLLGENLGWGTSEFATPSSMVTAWMGSPEHRANILSPVFRLVGVGVAKGAPVRGAHDAATYTTVFGRLR